MKNEQILIYFSICIFTLNAYGQNNLRLSENEKKNSIIFAPLNLIDPINPSFQLGYQRQLDDKIELQLEYGHIINKALFHYIINPNESKDDYSNKGYKLKIELKRYFMNYGVFRCYMAGELSYLENVSKVQNQFLVSDPNYNYSFELPNDGEEYGYTDYFTNSKTKIGINAKFGIKLIISSFFYESYIGIGAFYRNNIHSDRENMNDKPYDTSFLNDNNPKKMYMFNLPLNFKIGYRF